MIRQTNLVFKLKDLRVYTITTVGSTTPPLYTPAPTAPPSISEEIWWTDTQNPQGQGPFQTVYGCMRHYEEYLKLGYIVSKPQSAGTLIKVDFSAKKRILEP